MPDAYRVRGFNVPTPSECNLDRQGVATVASLGVRLHLAPVDPYRQKRLARLIASAETLRLEWGSLLQQIGDCLNEDFRGTRDSARCSSSLPRQ